MASKMHQMNHFYVQLLAFLYVFTSKLDLVQSYAPIDVRLDFKAHEIHRFDTLNFLAYTVLLIITVVTIWVFKTHRFKYIHETGLAIIYGLLVGALIKYCSNQSTEFTYLRVVPSSGLRPDYSTNQTFNELNKPLHQTNQLIISTKIKNLTDLIRNSKNVSLEKLNKDVPFSSMDAKQRPNGTLNDFVYKNDSSANRSTTIKITNSTVELTTQQARPNTDSSTLKPTLPLNNSSIKPTLSSNLLVQKPNHSTANQTTESPKKVAKIKVPTKTTEQATITDRPSTGRPIDAKGLKDPVNSSIKIAKQNNELTPLSAPPDSLYVNLDIENQNVTSNKNYVYLFKGELVNRDATDVYISQKATFDPNFFYNVIIPLIVFNAGYSLKRRFFFHNLGAIFTYSVFGTIISCFVVASILWTLMLLIPTKFFTFVDCLYFGAIISSTDTVTILAFFNHLNSNVEHLYALVLGESVLSDAVVIVLVRSIDLFEQDLALNLNTDQSLLLSAVHALKHFFTIFSLSVLVGFLVGILNALLTKFTKLKDFYLLESSLFVLMSYSAFLISELMELSGIVTILFCGIFQSHYNYSNLSPQTQEISKKFTELLSFLAENFIFTYLGVSMFIYPQHRWSISIILFSFVAIIIGRLLNIYPLSFLLNLNRSNKIPFKYQTVLFLSALRGAMAYSLAIQQTITESRQIILTTTSVIIIVTVIFGGSMLGKLLDLLEIDTGMQESDHEMKPFSKNTASSTNDADNVNLTKSAKSIDPQTNQYLISSQSLNEKAWLVRKWYIFDCRFFKPLLTNTSPTLIDTLPSIFLPISRLLTTTEQLNNSLNATYSDSNSNCGLNGFNNVNFTGIAADGVDNQDYHRYSFENNSNFEENYLSFGINDNRQQLNEILERSVGQLVQNTTSNDGGQQQIIFDRLTQTPNNQHSATKSGKQSKS